MDEIVFYSHQVTEVLIFILKIDINKDNHEILLLNFLKDSKESILYLGNIVNGQF